MNRDDADERALVTPDPWQALRAHTPARIALGRSGASLPTRELLAFGAAHAQARDAVQRPLDVEALDAELQAAGFATLRVHSAAPDRAGYLLRPDLGRRLDAPSLTALADARTRLVHHGDWLLPVVGDGLSSLGVQRQTLPLLVALRAQLPPGWALGPVVVASQARVALGDAIGEALAAPQVAVLIGERPGLSSPDSLGIYLTAAPKRGRSDAERNCISNVRPAGLSCEDAAGKLWWLVLAARRLGATGVALKDASDAVPEAWRAVLRIPRAMPSPSPASAAGPTGMTLRGVTPPLAWADFGLIAFDMDSTLIDIECVDEIAAAVGRKAEVAAITEAAMRGEIADYKASLRQRVALLKGVPVEALQRVYDERLRLNPGAETLVRTAQSHRLKTLLVSGGFTFFTDRIRDRLALDFTRSNVLEIEGGRLTGRLVDQPWGDICDGAEKRRMLLETCAALGIAPARAIAVGDGANDLPMMGEAGLSVAYHAKPAVRERAMVSIESGGLDRLLELFATRAVARGLLPVLP